MSIRSIEREFQAQSLLSRSIFCVLAYTVIALLVYAYASYQVTTESRPLIGRCQQLSENLSKTSLAVAELSTVVGSLSDPAADEYALITELGRIPEGTYKILYHNQKPQEDSL